MGVCVRVCACVLHMSLSVFLPYPLSDDIMEAPHSSKPVPLASIIEELETGDIVLMTGMTLSGSIIRLFDNSEFSHVALVRNRGVCAYTYTCAH